MTQPIRNDGLLVPVEVRRDPDYATDPFKVLARYYDRRVMEKGEPSIFHARRPSPAMTAAGRGNRWDHQSKGW